MTIYIDNGYPNRKSYLNAMAEEYGVKVKTVYAVAQLLGPAEDFDALVVALEDEANRLEF